jgi:hypothetical protein
VQSIDVSMLQMAFDNLNQDMASLENQATDWPEIDVKKLITRNQLELQNVEELINDLFFLTGDEKKFSRVRRNPLLLVAGGLAIGGYIASVEIRLYQIQGQLSDLVDFKEQQLSINKKILEDIDALKNDTQYILR